MLTFDYDRLGITPGLRVLDAGCGKGRHTFEALRRGARVVAADLDESALREGAAMDSDGEVPAGASFETVRADVLRLPFAAGAFDRVIASETLEHIPADSVAMAELNRVLAPGGRAVVTVPRWWPERVCWALSREYHSNEGGHVRIYRTPELTALLAESGFEVDGVDHAHALHAPYWWIKCAVGPERESLLPRLYHRFLVWDMTARPPLTRLLERALNPVLGKSVVVYATKPASEGLSHVA
ncbi:MAG: methyltransferase domain-containing protein [Actinomycetota bacterium]|nr:methyltransferase domain-containing protein [Actinomycetota bacterium]